ncbi:MAG: UvrD-helicase domain-containing protein [Solirubrobacterales bacterium]|nr:UvrD-helicase domain-containing protein [Solirubrobacterales bacterium]
MGDRPAPRSGPTAEQEAAIGNRDRDVFLEAGAGTGKTRVLVERYCDAVAVDGVEPERILAFTFTEKAAAEMRHRVRAELARRADGAGGPDRTRLLAAARSGEAAPITTIHGYCRRLLASHPAAAGLDPRFRVLDADEAVRVARSSFDEALAELAGADEAVALTAAGYRNRLGSLILAAHGELRNRGVTEAVLPELDASGIDGRDEPATPAETAAITGGYAALRRLITAFSERFEQRKAERSAVDFDDLQLLALELLRASPAILADQRERFDHLLVDEFQDTSPIQVDLVRLLAGPATRTFTVGDAAQSIYGFRGADLDSFRRVRAELAEESGSDATAMLGLTGSFRSTPAVLALVNLIGSELLPDFTPLTVGREPQPVPGPAGPTVELLLTDAKGWGDEEAGTVIPTVAADTPQSRVAEARALAGRLRELADEGVPPATMVLLLRAFTHVDAYAEALELAGLDPYVVGGRGYWSSQQVTDALSLLACVANPLDDEALLGALASPAAAVGPDALWMLRRIAGRRHLWPAVEELVAPAEGDRGGPGQTGAADGRAVPSDPETEAMREEQERWRAAFPAADRERLAHFHATLVGLRAGAAGVPLEELVERTLEGFGYDLAALLMDDGLRRTANLLKLVRLAAEYERHDGRDLRGFLDQAADRAALSDREAEAAVAAEDHAGIRVMTVHAAKGLEFDCVAVADLGRRLAGGGQPPSLRIAFEGDDLAPRIGLRLARAGAGTIDLAGYRELNDRAADADAEESGRLAYVAASRARHRLVLSGTVDREKELEPDDNPLRRKSVLGVLAPALGVSGEDGQIVLAEPPTALPGLAAGPFDPAAIRVGVNGAGSANAAALCTDRRDRGGGAERSGGTPPLLALADRPAAAARTLSYAALADYERCGYRFLAERVLRLGAGADIGTGDRDGAGPGGAGFGRAVHELLEWSARNSWRPPTASDAESALRIEGFGSAEAARAAELVAGWAGSPLLAELRADGAAFRPEVPFRIGLGDETVIRGTIDLIAERPGRPPLFVDYKTDRLERDAEPELTAAYEMQRLLYALAIAEATGAGEVESAYCFLQAVDRPIRGRHDGDAIAAGRIAIEERVSRIRAGDFSPTASPRASLCRDCPARARLCPYPTELTLGAG